jgi:hypothetical protein
VNVGSLVLLRCCPHGLPGTIRGERRGKFIVEFSDLAITLRLAADRLILASDISTRRILLPSACARASTECATTAINGGN